MSNKPEPTWVSDCGRAELYCGDCLEILPHLEPGSVDAVVTDIPYDVVNRKSSGLRNLDKGKADTATFTIQDVVAESSRIASGSIYVWCGTEQVSGLRAGFVGESMTTRLCVWHKSNPSPMNGEHLWLSGLETCVFARKSKAYFSAHCETPIWNGPIVANQVHPTEKPLWLMKRLVEASVPPDGVALDFCMGSGTTGVACVKAGRKFIGIELEPKYFEIAKRRIKEELESNLFLSA